MAHEVLKSFSPGVSKQFSNAAAGSNIKTVQSYGTSEQIDEITVHKLIYNKYAETTPLP